MSQARCAVCDHSMARCSDWRPRGYQQRQSPNVSNWQGSHPHAHRLLASSKPFSQSSSVTNTRKCTISRLTEMQRTPLREWRLQMGVSSRRLRPPTPMVQTRPRPHRLTIHIRPKPSIPRPACSSTRLQRHERKTLHRLPEGAPHPHRRGAQVQATLKHLTHHAHRVHHHRAGRVVRLCSSKDEILC